MPLTLTDLRPNEGANRPKKRVGRGTGSGHGKTAGRGTKGQKARSNPGIGRGFEGGQLPIQQRLPYKRGFTNIFKTPWEVVNIGQLEDVSVDGPVTPEVLYERGLIRGLEFPVKILGDGELTRALDIRAHAFSKSARERIEAVGGSVTVLERTDRWVEARPRSRREPLSRAEKLAKLSKATAAE
jgi:large subunit ribosomal protein L15